MPEGASNPASPGPAVPSIVRPTTPSVTPTAILSPTPSTASDNETPPEENNRVLYGILGTIGALALIFGATNFLRKRTQKQNNQKNDENCDSIRELLRKKQKELVESAKNWPKDKLKAVLKEKALGLLTDEQKKMLKQAEEAKEKFDKLKADVELLQNKFDLCMLKLPSKNELIFKKAEATDEDIKKYLEVEKTAIGQKTYSGISDPGEAKKEMRTNEVFFIFKNGKLAGTCQYELKTPDCAYLSGIVIIPDFQGQGIARKAADFRLKKLKYMKRIEVATHPDNAKMLHIYVSLGFKVESRRENYYGDGEPRMLLVLRR